MQVYGGKRGLWLAVVVAGLAGAGCSDEVTGPGAGAEFGEPAAAAGDGTPDPVTDLRVVSTTSNSVTLGWTQTSDGLAGASNYGLQAGTPTVSFSMTARSSTIAITGTAAGQPMTYTVSGLRAGTPYQFQMMSYRGSASTGVVIGELSNIATGTTASGSTAGQVVSVVASPSSYTFAGVGARAQISAVARDAAGATVPGTSFTWSSTNPSVVSVDQMGVITARAAGTALIVVASVCCNAADTVPTTVPNTPPQDPVDPSGFTLQAERDWSSLTESGWSYARIENSTVMSEAGAPRSAPAFVRQHYPAGMSGGGEPSVYEKAFAGGDSVYLQYWVRYSPNWHGHASGVNKMVYLAVGSGDNIFRLYMSATGVDGGPLRLQVRTQATVEGARNLDPNLASAQIVRGQWHRIEVMAVTNTPGQRNGQVHWWLDGRKVGEVRDIGWVRAGENVNWTRFHWAPVWGGRGDVLPAAQYMDMDHVRISAR